MKSLKKEDLKKLTNKNLDILSLFFNKIRNQIVDGKNLHSIEIYVSDMIDIIQAIKEERLLGF